MMETKEKEFLSEEELSDAVGGGRSVYVPLSPYKRCLLDCEQSKKGKLECEQECKHLY